MLQKQVDKCAEGIIKTDTPLTSEVGQGCAGEEFRSWYVYRAYLDLGIGKSAL